MTVRRDNNFIWITWLPDIMTGDKSCLWGPWFRAHFQNYEKMPSDFNEAVWKLDHSRLMQQLLAEQPGEKIHVQDQNKFRYVRESGLTVSGVPDLVIQSGRDTTVYDAKTGQPRTSHQMQVMLYMYFLPQCLAEYRGMALKGCVVYKTHRVPIPADAIDEKFAGNVHYFLDVLDSDAPPLRVPSEQDCRFCDITKADCPERVDSATISEAES